MSKEKSSIAKITVAYIKDHPSVFACVKKELINYSALARVIAIEEGLVNKSSQDAIIMAATRFANMIKSDVGNEKKLRSILSKSSFEVKNKMCVVVVSKKIDSSILFETQKNLGFLSSSFFVHEGSECYTIICQEKQLADVEKKLSHSILNINKELALISISSSTAIESTPGVVAFLTALFSENGVNIVELFSCWTDTVFVVKEKDLTKVLSFLNFS